MDGTDGQVPAPRAARPATGPTAVPGVPRRRSAQDLARVPELAALLGEIDALRTTLETDLSLAAAALEAGADDLAGELVDGDRSELRAFSARAAAHLIALDAAAAATPAPVPTPVAALPRRRRPRLLQAAPLLAAAAALLGFAAGVVPDRGVASQPATTLTSAAQASYELNRLASLGATDEALRQAAEELNAELSALVAQASGDPAAAAQALVLLDSTDDVLTRSNDTGLLRGVLAEARALRARLQGALPAAALPPAPVPQLEAPVLTLRERRASEPTRRPAPSSTTEGSSAEQPAAPSAAAAPSPTPEPRPEPTPAAPSSEPTAAPTQQPTEPPFLQPGFGL